MTAELPIIDWHRHSQLRTLLQGEFASLLARYCEDASHWIAAIKAAAMRGDREAIARAAHMLIGDSFQFGAEAVGRGAARIEHMARDGMGDHPFPAIMRHVRDLDSSFRYTLHQFDLNDTDRGDAPVAA